MVNGPYQVYIERKGRIEKAPVSFRDDESRLRDPRARENFAVLRHIALTRLKNDQREKMGIKNKRLKAGWDDSYLSQLLFETG